LGPINEVARNGWCLNLIGLQDHASWRASNLEKVVVCVQRRVDHPSFKKWYWFICQIWRDKKFLFIISGKFEWKSPTIILVTRNPNWSQRLGMESGCVKGRYRHLNYALPKVSCIVLLSNKI